MTNEEFLQEVDKQVIKCKRVLSKRAGKYGTHGDRLKQFKDAAVLQNERPEEALGGMMVKHTTLLYDMISGAAIAGDWSETITDHINYLFLLRALLEDMSDAE